MKITYYKQNKLDIKRTALSFGKYYISNYVAGLREDKLKDS